MEDIKKIIKEKEDKIINIDKEINSTNHINIKEHLLNDKNKLIIKIFDELINSLDEVINNENNTEIVKIF